MLRATSSPAAPCNSMCLLTFSTFHSLGPSSNANSFFVSASPPFDSRFMLRFKFQQFQKPHLNLRVVYGAELGVAALKKKRGQVGSDVVGMDDFDDDDDDDGDDDIVGGDGDDDEEDDDEGEVIPFEQMKTWFKNRPRGFGVGILYDTSVEDKLLDEMLQSREAQAANINNLKKNPITPGARKSDPKKRDAEVVPVGNRVRLVNLPKKKNIHRDLKSALQGIPGIIGINPAVSGNKKTRDPICKGFAFVDFKCKADAVRFVQLYSCQTITFGKIQRQIKCELLKAPSSSSASLELSRSLDTAPHLMVPAFEEHSNEDSDMDHSTLSSWDGTALDDLGNQICGDEQDVVGENQESAISLMVDRDDTAEPNIDSDINSLPSEQGNSKPTTEESSAKLKQEKVHKKRLTSKEKAEKVPKFNVRGSARKLKIKEKAVLSDVLSKYGSKAALVSKDR